MSIHGNLEPLVKIDLSPRNVFRVGVWWGQEERILMVSVRQRVKTFKSELARQFPVQTGCLRVWYYDQHHWETQGPQEMKWPEKGLYTYNLQVQSGVLRLRLRHDDDDDDDDDADIKTLWWQGRHRENLLW